MEGNIAQATIDNDASQANSKDDWMCIIDRFMAEYHAKYYAKYPGTVCPRRGLFPSLVS
jgi:hypothetical protein